MPAYYVLNVHIEDDLAGVGIYSTREQAEAALVAWYRPLDPDPDAINTYEDARMAVIAEAGGTVSLNGPLHLDADL